MMTTALVRVAGLGAALIAGCAVAPADHEELAPITGSPRLLALGYTDDGDVYVGLDAQLRIYDPALRQAFVHVPLPPPDPQSKLTEVLLSADGTTMAATWEHPVIGGFDVQVTRLPDPAIVAGASLPYYTGYTGNVALSSRGDLLATVLPGQVSVAVVPSGAKLVALETLIDTAGFAPTGDTLYGRCSVEDNPLSLCAVDARTGAVGLQMRGGLSKSGNFALTRDGGYVVSVQDDQDPGLGVALSIGIRRTSDGSEERRIGPVEGYAPPRWVAAAAGAAHWASRTTRADRPSGPTSILIGTGAGEVVHAVEIPPSLFVGGALPQFQFSPDGRELAIAPYPTGDRTAGIVILDVATAEVKSSRILWTP